MVPLEHFRPVRLVVRARETDKGEAEKGQEDKSSAAGGRSKGAAAGIRAARPGPKPGGATAVCSATWNEDRRCQPLPAADRPGGIHGRSRWSNLWSEFTRASGPVTDQSIG